MKPKFDVARVRRFEDPRDMPLYGIPVAAHYLRIPVATLRSWALGRDYQTETGRRRFKPLITLPDPKRPLLSFFNLAECHVLSSCRRKYNLPLRAVRLAVSYLQRKLKSKRPLIDREFATDGVSLFVNELGKLVDASADGQVVMRGLVEQYLQRLERENHEVTRLYPFTRPQEADSPRTVFIDPRIAFGKPVLASSRVETGVIADRYKAGDSIDDLADDYGCSRLEIEEALRCELRLDAA